MKKRKIIIAIATVTFSLIVFLILTTSYSIASAKLYKGLKGSINGIPTCHCPDDKGDCYCSIL